MPAEAELTSAEIKELFDLLLSKREMLESQLSESRDALKPVALDQTLQGRVSRMDAIQQQGVAFSAHKYTSTTLQKVASALKRFETLEFGYCRKCEEPIGYGRLKAQPESALCLSCQSSMDNQ